MVADVGLVNVYNASAPLMMNTDITDTDINTVSRGTLQESY